MYVTVCVSGVYEVQKRVSDPQQLELTMVVSHQVRGGTKTLVLYKGNRYHRADPLNRHFYFLFNMSYGRSFYICVL